MRFDVRAVSEPAADAARARQDRLTKPPGSLGVLEDVGVRLAAIARRCPPPLPTRPAVGVFAGDHGVLAQGVSPWPGEVTAAMLANFAAGGAVINALSRQIGAVIAVVDVGVAAPYGEADGVLVRNVLPGTADLSETAAMSRDQAEAALAVGAEVADALIADGADCLITGDMGIGNTTPAAALIAAFTDTPPAEVAGPGTGDEVTQRRKVAVLDRAFARHRHALVDPGADPIGALAAVGGLEHAALAGFIVAGARAGVPVLLDGVIACSAALVAVALAPSAGGYLIGGHRGVEPGVAVALDALGLRPLLDLDLRLGEGSGGALAFPLVQAAARLLSEVATFAEAGIAEAGTR